MIDLTCSLDVSGTLAALEAFASEMDEQLRQNDQFTAERVAAEARRRVARRTGETAEHITVEDAGKGYRVVVGEGAGRFLEHGTAHMQARPFFDAAGRLEAGAHERRAAEAVQTAIDHVGLGSS